eukprot:Nitzschia sp. Nitz4//scaffold69_size99277//1695//3221//NITZ4_004614-RA/size99277-augustus-gene-0.7-mRNA-1//-1//CDS//3329556658//4870//frame0
MNVTGHTSRASKSSSKVESRAAPINLYQEIPNVEVSLDDFEEFALDRLKVLKMLEQLKLRHVDTSQYREKLDPLLRRLADPTKDSISHYVLRLAYCRTEDLRRWFLAQEVELLRWRLGLTSSHSASVQGMKEVLPHAQLVSSKELDNTSLRQQIATATPSLKGDPSIMPRMYKVPFTHALDLVRHRQVFIKAGMAYIPETKLVDVLCGRFRADLSKQLLLLSSVPLTPSLERTHGFLKNVSTVNTVSGEFDPRAGMDGSIDINASNVPQYVKSMPLCMANLQLSLQREKHLKHWGRLQYGLFLKGTGLSLDDALVYFERMFTAKGLDKGIKYSLRHMYGKEGKRSTYPPYSCAKIVNGNAPNANEHHGCPFKHSPANELSHLLSRLGVQPAQQKPILAQQQSHNYQLACLEHFKVLHPDAHTHRDIPMENLGNHPNAWFNASVQYHSLTSGDKDGKDDVPATPGLARQEPIHTSSSASVSP